MVEETVESIVVVSAAVVLGVASSIPWKRRRWHPIGPAGMAFIAVALILTLLAIWVDSIGRWSSDRFDLYIELIAGTAWVFAVAIPLVGILSLARLHRRYDWVRIWTIVSIACLVVAICYLLLGRFYDGAPDLLGRAIGVFAILSLCGVLAVGVLHRVSAIQLREGVRTVELSVSLTCPRCAETQELTVGRSKCSKCGLRFSIEIEEDACATCGYPLYRLESAVCPECGTPIAESGEGG
jgi:hypothetical protein